MLIDALFKIVYFPTHIKKSRIQNKKCGLYSYMLVGRDEKIVFLMEIDQHYFFFFSCFLSDIFQKKLSDVTKNFF